MSPLTFDDVRRLLPELDELRPVLDHLLAGSIPDDKHRWAGSGDVETSGARLVEPDALSGAARTLADREHEHTTLLYEAVIDAIRHISRGDDGGATRAFLEAARLEEERDRPERAARYAEAAYQIAQEGGDQPTGGLALRRRARAYRTLGRLTEAERDYRRAHETANAVGDPRGSSEAAIGVGNVLQDEGRWDEAQAWYQTALATLDDHGLETAERWQALLNLHVVLRSKGSVDESLRPLREAESVAAGLDDGGAIQFLENARGQWHMVQGEFAEAERCLRAAIDASTGAGAEVTIRLNLAETLLADDRPLEAAEEARRAEREALVARLPQKLPEVYRILGRIAASEGNPDAFVLFERALEIIATQHLPELEEAVTLQAYAYAVARSGEVETSADLQARADELYRKLKISHRRSEWSDHYGSRRSDDDSNHGMADDV